MKREVLRSLRVLACAGPPLARTGAVLVAQEPGPYEARSPDLARRLSLLGMAVPSAAAYGVDKMGVEDPGGELAIGGLVFAGLVLGPVLGYVYAGETGRGMAHAGMRAAVVAATAGVAVGICSVGDCDILGSPGPVELTLAAAVLIAGSVATGMLIVRDIDELGDRVRARNQALGEVSVRPTYFPESRTAGLLLTWRR